MTVSSIEPVNNYTGNSSNTKFDFDFLIENESELVVQHINNIGEITILQNGIDYLINEIGNENGSYITFPIAGSSYGVLGNDEKISLILSLVIKQEKEIKNSLFFNFDTLEWMFDYIVRILQILNRKIVRCIKVNEGEGETVDDLMQSLNQAQLNAKNYANSAKNSEQTTLGYKTDTQTIYNSASGFYNDIQTLKQQAETSITTGRANIASDLSSALTQLNNKAIELDSQYLNKANISLNNLDTTGEARFSAKANADLSNSPIPHINSCADDSVYWIRAYSDGWCEQGGVLLGTSGTVTLIRNYRDTNYSVQVTIRGTASGSDNSACVLTNIIDSSQFSISYCARNIQPSTVNGVTWRASGFYC